VGDPPVPTTIRLDLCRVQLCDYFYGQVNDDDDDDDFAVDGVSVCLSHANIDSKLMTVGLRGFHRRVT